MAHRLLINAEQPVDPGWEAAWVAEVQARLGRLERGEASTRDARLFLDELEASLRQR